MPLLFLIYMRSSVVERGPVKSTSRPPSARNVVAHSRAHELRLIQFNEGAMRLHGAEVRHQSGSSDTIMLPGSEGYRVVSWQVHAGLARSVKRCTVRVCHNRQERWGARWEIRG